MLRRLLFARLLDLAVVLASLAFVCGLGLRLLRIGYKIRH